MLDQTSPRFWLQASSPTAHFADATYLPIMAALALELSGIDIWGQHTATKDMVGYKCGVANVMDMEVTTFTEAMISASMNVTGCKKISDGTEGLVGFIIGAPRPGYASLLAPSLTSHPAPASRPPAARSLTDVAINLGAAQPSARASSCASSARPSPSTARLSSTSPRSSRPSSPHRTSFSSRRLSPSTPSAPSRSSSAQLR